MKRLQIIIAINIKLSKTQLLKIRQSGFLDRGLRRLLKAGWSFGVTSTLG